MQEASLTLQFLPDITNLLTQIYKQLTNREETPEGTLS